MKIEGLKKLSQTLDEFERNHLNLTDRATGKVILEIFTPLLDMDGYKRNQDSMKRHSYLHYIASKGKKTNKHTIGVVFKKGQAIASKDEVEQLVAGCTIDGIDSLIFISQSPTELTTEDYDKDLYPVKFQKFDFHSIRSWIKNLIESNSESEISKILRHCTQRIIEAVLKEPDYLDDIEWRDLERMIAELFRGLGFDVELTSSSKDGGKDVILEFKTKEQIHSYIVEIKHWRSMQKVGKANLVHFVKVVAKEKRVGGLFLSTYGFADDAIESLTKIERKKVRFGNKEKIISLCETYVKGKTGLWLKDLNLEKVLLEKTF